MRYRLLEHTADALIEAYGDTLAERFANAAYALFDQMTDVTKVAPVGEVRLVLSADTTEQLLVDFLQELLFLHDADNYVFCEFDVEIMGGNLDAVAKGEAFDQSKHPKRAVVKGITYHNLKLDDEGRSITLLFDV
ncbi:TPA: archease [Thermoplasmata archaeon]|nr:archease [Thermoplasmata archaeon]